MNLSEERKVFLAASTDLARAAQKAVRTKGHPQSLMQLEDALKRYFGAQEPESTRAPTPDNNP